MSTQLHNINILNYFMHKYIEVVKLLLEFKLLYDIEFFLKKMEQDYFLLLNYCESSSLILKLGINKI